MTAPAGRPVALVIGAYGLIGAALSRAFAEDGWAVRGLGRSVEQQRRAPRVEDWVVADLRDLTDAEAWTPALSGVSLVVNAAGALDEGPRDALADVHGAAVEALVSAADAAAIPRIIQISAPGVATDASTRFFSSKARGDAAVAARAGAWAILRPGLVVAPEAYGGSALLRGLAATPLVLPIAQAEAQAQTVAMADVEAAAIAAARGELGDALDLALVEPETQRLEDIALCLRDWLGVAPPRVVLRTPDWLSGMVARLADLAVAFGWRTPLSSTSRRVLRDGIIADAAPAAAALGRPLQTLKQGLASMAPPPSARLVARTFLLRPLLVLTLSLFWIVSGLIGLGGIQSAAAVLDSGPLAGAAARIAVATGGLIDIALGLAVLYKPLARAACLGMIAVTGAYLIGGTVLTPTLWLDPLGPLVKAIPAAMLALTTLALLEDR